MRDKWRDFSRGSRVTSFAPGLVHTRHDRGRSDWRRLHATWRQANCCWMMGGILGDSSREVKIRCGLRPTVCTPELLAAEFTGGDPRRPPKAHFLPTQDVVTYSADRHGRL